MLDPLLKQRLDFLNLRKDHEKHKLIGVVDY